MEQEQARLPVASRLIAKHSKHRCLLRTRATATHAGCAPPAREIPAHADILLHFRKQLRCRAHPTVCSGDFCFTLGYLIAIGKAIQQKNFLSFMFPAFPLSGVWISEPRHSAVR